MSILLISGSGYIWSHTVEYFLEQNEDIIVVDNLLTGHKEAILTDKFYNCDIRDKEKLDKVFKEKIRSVLKSPYFLRTKTITIFKIKYIKWNINFI